MPRSIAQERGTLWKYPRKKINRDFLDANGKCHRKLSSESMRL